MRGQTAVQVLPHRLLLYEDARQVDAVFFNGDHRFRFHIPLDAHGLVGKALALFNGFHQFLIGETQDAAQKLPHAMAVLGQALAPPKL